MQFSAFKGPFEERIESWNHKLFIIGEVLDKWLEVRARRLFVEVEPLEDVRRSAQVQRNWMYLQPIFESPDINKQLPAEGKKFATVNKNWCATVTAAKARPVLTRRRKTSTSRRRRRSRAGGHGVLRRREAPQEIKR